MSLQSVKAEFPLLDKIREPVDLRKRDDGKFDALAMPESALGLLTGMVQAYIFSILAAVYIAAATRVPKPKSAATQPVENHLQAAH